MPMGPENKMNMLVLGGVMAASLGGVALMQEVGHEPEGHISQRAVSLPTPIAELNLVDEDPRPPHPTYVAPSPTHIPRIKPSAASRSRHEYIGKFSYDSGAKYLPLTDEEWDVIVTCESDHDRYNVYKGHYSYFQFDLPTWHSNGGKGNPMDYSYAEQLVVAERTESRRGTQPWTCAKASVNHHRNIVARRNPNYLSGR